jgi:hypothetical protein
VVPPASIRISRVRTYSRRCITPHRCRLPTGLSPAPVTRSSGLRLNIDGRRRDCRPLHASRTTPTWHRRQAVPPDRFGLLPVRSPLLRESSLFLRVLRCFSSPGALQHSCWWLAVRQPGCPIRISPAHRLPAPPRSISPRGRVLPRLPPPRHPPCALIRQSPLVTSIHAPFSRVGTGSARASEDEVAPSSQRSRYRSVTREWFTIRRHSTMAWKSQTSCSTKIKIQNTTYYL